jgi:Arc/MetJ-type ribon-helix-helix transcriptional regulator
VTSEPHQRAQTRDDRETSIYAQSQGFKSRSAVVHTAVRMLRSSKLGDAYADAWREWEDSGDVELWDQTTADGLA